MIIPAYFNYDSSQWQQLRDASVQNGNAVGGAVFGVHIGPGQTFDQNWFTTVKDAQAAGVKIIGYTYTSFATRPIADVEADIDKYYEWYGVDGIFIDNATSDSSTSHLDYFKQLYEYVRNKNSTLPVRPEGAGDGKLTAGRHDYVVVNFGSPPSTNQYMDYADIVCNFEDIYDTYVDSYPSQPVWVTDGTYPPSRFWHIVHTTAYADLPNAVRLAKRRKAGYMYVTDDGGETPYNTLPAEPYWTYENDLLLAGR